MATSRISGLPLKTTPIGADSIEIVDSTGPSEAKATVQSVIDMFGEVVAADPTELDIATVGATTTFTIEPTIARRALTINPQTGTTYTPVAADAAALVTLANAAAITVTLPDAVFNLGETLTFARFGDGQVSFVAGAGAAIVIDAGFTAATRAKWAVVQAILVDTNLLGAGTDVWLLVGGLAAA